ncbi:HAD family hydrolase [Pseudomarimonas arenosa]|uniref:HAD family hydrolase n=1 Tax=Pseudomarimonas arenosa TaxID=2774145 RepID=A0AAW3ZQ29_9GAMM|nr:HAD family hydrolase [Pseudomarimonas arenosa]MBD8526739.1 HAD family hydrolase [Pseudomarimonas arenosa]
MSATLRVAMWSGPRNISTAMMRAWENRDDCEVVDEPLYAHYLAATGAEHPARDEVIAAGNPDWRQVVDLLTGPAPHGSPIWYQKHMCHHLLPDISLEWIDRLNNILLIRDPHEVVASYLRTRDTVSAEEIGLPQQLALFQHLERVTGSAPLVIDSGDFLAAPEAHLRAICSHLNIPFSEKMLSWPAGPRDSDGVWAPHWYHAVWKSTGFGKPHPERRPTLTGLAADVAAQCQPIYQQLHTHRLQV